MTPNNPPFNNGELMTIMVDSDDPFDPIYPNLLTFPAVFTINMGVEIRDAAGTTVTTDYHCTPFTVTILDFCGTIDLADVSAPPPLFDIMLT